MNPGVNRSRGFVLVEAAAGAAVVAILAALLLVWASDARRQASLGDDLANLNVFATGTGAYGADNDDRVWGFSWRKGVDYGFGGVAGSEMQALANQAVDIMRRRGGRDDISPMSNWIPQILYSPLVLADYLDESLPARWMASPGDRVRLLWQSDPGDGFFALGPTERPDGLGNALKRWPYSSSYQLTPAFWSPDAMIDGQGTVDQSMGVGHGFYNLPARPLDQRRLSEVAFPSQKVMVHDTHQRHFGPRQAFFAYPEARVSVLMADGSASVRLTSESNRGFLPNSPTSPLIPRVSYRPEPWEPQTLSGADSDLVFTHYRFTRSGLRGRDFGGPEVPWVP